MKLIGSLFFGLALASSRLPEADRHYYIGWLEEWQEHAFGAIRNPAKHAERIIIISLGNSDVV